MDRVPGTRSATSARASSAATAAALTAERAAARARAKDRARTAWVDLRDRLATTTPAAVGRAVLTVAVVGAAAWAIGSTWPAFLPFALGGLLAYAVLPVVDGLDRFMPRALAAAIAMLGVLAALAAVLVIVVPPLTSAVIELAASLPPVERIQAELDEALAQLPDDARGLLAPVVTSLVVFGRDGLESLSGGLDDAVPAAVQAAVGVVGALLGLLVLPAWLLSVLGSQRRAALAVDRRMAGWLRPDAWAVIRMFDRAAGTYLRGFVVTAAVVGFLVWLGLTTSPRVGGPEYPGALAIGVLAGAVQVIPEVGPILGFLPALLALAIDPSKAVPYVIIYIAARWLGSTLVGTRFGGQKVAVHPAILVPGIVIFSQLGLLWLLLSAPILTFLSDLVRYLHGRLSEPPRPAGVLPRQPVPTSPAAATTVARIPVGARARAARAAASARAPATTSPVSVSTTGLPAAPPNPVR
jgi:predicted PurR-regulated permease PerM